MTMSLDAYKARIDLILNETAGWSWERKMRLRCRFLVKRLLAKRASSLAEPDRTPVRSGSASETPILSPLVSLDSCYGCGGTIHAGLSVSGSVRCHDCRAAA